MVPLSFSDGASVNSSSSKEAGLSFSGFSLPLVSWLLAGRSFAGGRLTYSGTSRCWGRGGKDRQPLGHGLRLPKEGGVAWSLARGSVCRGATWPGACP